MGRCRHLRRYLKGRKARRECSTGKEGPTPLREVGFVIGRAVLWVCILVIIIGLCLRAFLVNEDS